MRKRCDGADTIPTRSQLSSSQTLPGCSPPRTVVWLAPEDAFSSKLLHLELRLHRLMHCEPSSCRLEQPVRISEQLHPHGGWSTGQLYQQKGALAALVIRCWPSNASVKRPISDHSQPRLPRLFWSRPLRHRLDSSQPNPICSPILGAGASPHLCLNRGPSHPAVVSASAWTWCGRW